MSITLSIPDTTPERFELIKDLSLGSDQVLNNSVLTVTITYEELNDYFGGDWWKEEYKDSEDAALDAIEGYLMPVSE